MIKKLNKKDTFSEDLDDDGFGGFAPGVEGDAQDDEEESKLNQEFKEFIDNEKRFINKSSLDIYFNEVNKHKLLSKAEEKELGMIINENYKQILTCLCMTENIADFMLQLKDIITKTPFNELHKYIDVEYFGSDYRIENHDKLIHQIILLINNFLNVHRAFLNKNKCISNLQFDKLKGASKVLNAFSWMQIDKVYLDKLIDSIKDTVTSTQYYYNIVQKCRVNKKKKNELANKKLMDIEKKFGMKFENILLFIEHINKFRSEQNKARSKMVLSNLRLVIFAAHRFYDESLKFSEMLSVGHLGLIKAIERFNFQLSNKFSTYAMWWISHKISRKIQKAKLIHVPSHLYEELQRFNRLKRKLTTMASSESSMNPVTASATTDEEICRQLNLDIDKIQRAKKESRSVKSLDVQIGEGGSNGVTPSEVLTCQKVNFNKFYEDEQIMQTLVASSNYSFVSANSEKCMRIANLCKRGIQEQFIKRTIFDNNAHNYGYSASESTNEYEEYTSNYMYDEDERSHEDLIEENVMRSSAANALSIKCKQRYLIQRMNSDKSSGHSNSIRSMFKEIQNMRKNPQLMDFQCMDKLQYIYTGNPEDKNKSYRLQLPSDAINLFDRRKKVAETVEKTKKKI